MTGYICPVCSETLNARERTLRCKNGHCYDMAKSGYVNLLMSNAAGAKRHGDDALMIRARSSFLEKGYYAPLRDKICEMLMPHAVQNMIILDAGCGDGWYAQGLSDALLKNGMEARIFGIDISRDALKAAAKRPVDMELAVASVFHLPMAQSSCDAALSIFSPLAQEEFARVLRAGGILLRVVPLEEHLWELKQAVYAAPRKNPPDSERPAGFSLVSSAELRYSIRLTSNSDIRDLFAMTPYYYKSSKEDQSKLESIDTLTVTAAFGLRLWKNDKYEK